MDTVQVRRQVNAPHVQLNLTLNREMRLGGSDTAKWTIQTVLLGFPSLRLIKAQYNAQKKK